MYRPGHITNVLNVCGVPLKEICVSAKIKFSACRVVKGGYMSGHVVNFLSNCHCNDCSHKLAGKVNI